MHEASLSTSDSDPGEVWFPPTHSRHMSYLSVTQSSSVTLGWCKAPTAHGPGPLNSVIEPSDDSQNEETTKQSLEDRKKNESSRKEISESEACKMAEK